MASHRTRPDFRQRSCRCGAVLSHRSWVEDTKRKKTQCKQHEPLPGRPSTRCISRCCPIRVPERSLGDGITSYVVRVSSKGVASSKRGRIQTHIGEGGEIKASGDVFSAYEPAWRLKISKTKEGAQRQQGRQTLLNLMQNKIFNSLFSAGGSPRSPATRSSSRHGAYWLKLSGVNTAVMRIFNYVVTRP